MTAHHALGCRDLSRVDFILPPDGEAEVLEINTIPGFTSHSLVPMAAAAEGISFEQLVDRIATMAMELHDIKKVEPKGGNKPSMQGKPASDTAKRVVKILDNTIRPHDTLGLMKDTDFLQGLNTIFAKR